AEAPTSQCVRNLDKEADDIEAGRLFYVAATRARQRLPLLACAKADEDLRPKEPSKRSLLAKIWWQAREHFGEAPADAIAEPERMPIHDVLHRLPDGFALPKAPPSVKWAAPDEGRQEEEIEFSWAGETARHVGTIVHRWLQRIADDELRTWDAARIDALASRFAKELERRGIPPRELKASTEQVSVALKNAISDERGRSGKDGAGALPSPALRREGVAALIELGLALLASAFLGTAVVIANVGLRHLDPARGALVSIPSTTLLLWLLAPFLLSSQGW